MWTRQRVPVIPVLVVALLVLLILAPISQAATPSSGTMSTGTPTLTWSSGPPFTGSSSDPIAADCSNSHCDDYILTLSGTNPSIHKVTVRIDWANPANDLDLHVFNHVTGAQIAVDGAAVGNSEQVTFTADPTITYRVSVLFYRSVAESYTAVANLVTVPAEPPNTFRTATYSRLDFGFRSEVKLPSQERSPVFIDQDVEPEIEIDRFGTIYIGAIRGVPGGTDFWRSDDGGTSFRFLGQPDGAHLPDPIPPTEGGAGGGDDDVALGDPFFVVPPVAGVSPGIQSTGRVYVTSLWLGSATMSVSIDRGDHFAAVPFTTAQLDRQWNVARGEKTVYMSLRKAAQLELGQHDVYVVQSDDGGLTWPKSSFVQDPFKDGVADDVGGNSVIQSNGVLLGTFVSRDKHDLYVWRTPKYPATTPANIPVGTMDAPVFTPNTFDTGLIFHGAGALTTSNRFPIMAVDQGDNIHIVFSDRQNIYLVSCPAAADPTLPASWTKPVPLNAPGIAGFEFTRTCVLPWVHGGAPGKVAVIWYATDVAGDPDTPAFETAQVPWKLVYAQVENALSTTPSVYLDIASKQGGGVVHKGQICLRGLGCPSGTRELAEYSSLTVDNQGFPNIIYEADWINGADPPSTAAICFFTKGVNRPLSAGSGPVAEIDCNDPGMSQSGGWHSMADDRATDGHYCRNVGATKNSKAYMEFHYTGDRVDLLMARGPRGGNVEVKIDGVSKGKVDFYRPPSDPANPDNSGKRDLTFGEFASFSSSAGPHTFRLNVLNDTGLANHDIIYVDGFLIHGSTASAGGNPSENTITFTGTAPSGVGGAPGMAVEHVTTTEKAQLIEGVLEVPEEALGRRELKILNPVGAVLGDAPNLMPTGSLQAVPTTAGSYGFAVMNWGSAAMPYTLRVITTNSTTGHLAGAIPSGGVAAGSRKVVVPDPVDGVAVMRYALTNGGHVVVRVYDVAGRLVHRFEEDQPAGSYGISWDGRRSDGRRVPSGIYFYRVSLPGGKETVQRTAILR